MEEYEMKPKKGDEITAIFQGRVNKHVYMLRVSKAGRKYVHGMTLWINPDGDIREGHECKINLEESTIYMGLRKDLQELEYQYRDDYQSWKNQKKTRQNELEYELKNYVWDGLKEWEAKNPMPKPPEFPSPN